MNIPFATFDRMHAVIRGEMLARAAEVYDKGWFIQGDDATNHWSGAKIIVTELRIWRTCRTAEQITNNINNTGTPNADLVAYWRLNKESYNEAEGYFEDLSGNGVLLQTSSSTNITWIEDIESTATSTPWP